MLDTAELTARRTRVGTITAPTGTTISAKSWMTEAPLRMLMNNLDPAVAENPNELVVYGGIGRAARDWASYDQIIGSLKALEGSDVFLQDGVMECAAILAGQLYTVILITWRH